MSETKTEEEIVIDADDDKEAPEVVVTEEAPKPDNIEDSIRQLREQLDQERNARIAAENQAREAAQREYHARNQTDEANLQLVTSAIDRVRSMNESLRANMAAAMQGGDFEQAAAIQEEMSANTAKLLQLEQGKAAMEEKPKNEPPPAQSDPVEALASRLTPRSAEWIRKNPNYARDPRLFNKMVSAHNLVTADGIAPDTDEYFREVENVLKIRPQAAPQPKAEDDPTFQAAQVTQRRSSPAAAPVSRGNASTTRVRLTEEEREMASLMKMTPEEYAKNKMDLKKSGKLN